MLTIDLTDKVALVTGASRGIGSACAKILADCGAKVIINYNNNAILAEELVHEIGENAIAYRGNVSDPEEVNRMMKYVYDTYGKLDILVNNAGTTTENTIEDLTLEEIEKVFQVNLFGTFYSCKYAVPYMKQNGGSIINISSTSMYTGAGGGAHYASSKSALLGLTRNLSRDYGKHNIRTNALAVTLVKTELLAGRKIGDLQKKIENVPLHRLCEPEEVAYMVAFLSSSLAGYITGEVITMDGGRTFA